MKDTIPNVNAIFSGVDLMVYIPLLLWFIFISVLFVILFMKFTINTRDKRTNKNPFINETFAMPRGIMRALITLSLLFVVLLIQVVYMNVADFEGKTKHIMIAFQMMLAFYFGDKALGQITTKRDSRQEQTKENEQLLTQNSDSVNFDTENSVG